MMTGHLIWSFIAVLAIRVKSITGQWVGITSDNSPISSINNNKNNVRKPFLDDAIHSPQDTGIFIMEAGDNNNNQRQGTKETAEPTSVDDDGKRKNK